MAVPGSILTATIAFVIACWVSDIRTREIPNALPALGFALGLALNASHSGAAGLLASLGGSVVAGGLLLGPFLLGGVGGGDVKMMAAIGALLGPWSALNAVLIGFVLGGLVMMVHLVRIGRLREKLGATVRMFTGALASRSLSPMRLSDSDAGAVTLPYSVPLGLGTVVVLLSRFGIGGLLL